jgi:hypothetical protein
MRKLHNEVLRDLYLSPNISTVMNSRKMIWAELVACMDEMNHAHEILVLK